MFMENVFCHTGVTGNVKSKYKQYATDDLKEKKGRIKKSM